MHVITFKAIPYDKILQELKDRWRSDEKKFNDALKNELPEIEINKLADAACESLMVYRRARAARLYIIQ